MRQLFVIDALVWASTNHTQRNGQFATESFAAQATHRNECDSQARHIIIESSVQNRHLQKEMPVFPSARAQADRNLRKKFFARSSPLFVAGKSPCKRKKCRPIPDDVQQLNDQTMNSLEMKRVNPAGIFH